MYIPAAFAESDLTTLAAFLEQHSFGLLVSQSDGVPVATHLPLLLDRTQGEHGCLLGHMARANPQWQDAPGQKVLAIFTGPHTYISPSWYEAEAVVPTWNYVAVHVYGEFQRIDNPEDLLGVLQRSVAFYEQGLPQPWTLHGTSTLVERLLPQIVGFRIPIERLEGKWKLNQNHPIERRERVIRALKHRGGMEELAVAALMEKTLPPPKG